MALTNQLDNGIENVISVVLFLGGLDGMDELTNVSRPALRQHADHSLHQLRASIRLLIELVGQLKLRHPITPFLGRTVVRQTRVT